VERKHRLRAGLEWCAGVKSGGHGGLGEFLNEMEDKAPPAECPGGGSPPVCPDESIDDPGIMPGCQHLMKWNLDQGRGGPDQAEGRDAAEKEHGALAQEKQQSRAGKFRQHERPHKPRDQVHVALVIEDEFLVSHLLEQGVVDDLNRPDQAGKRRCDGKVDD
jgi:hypothetical protein